jgi:molecular chaperone DnaK (HSP70)
MPPFAQEPWSGDEKLVIGIDIGTTQTAVSYIHLYPGAYLIDLSLRKR